MPLVGDSKLAVSQCVPELDCAIARSRDDLAVIGREGDREDVVAVANKTASGNTSCKFPEAEGLIPRGREGVGTV